MIGTIANTICILVGSVAGSALKKGIKEEYSQAMYNAMGLAATGLGINTVIHNMPESNYPVLFILSLSLGSIIGCFLDLSGRFNRLIERISKGDGANLSKGLSTAILLFCIGTLSILGPVNSALYGDNTFLYTNATLDLVTSLVLATTYGIGIAIAAGVLFCWQGLIYLMAMFFGNIITLEIMTEISLVGGFLITSSGLAILNIKDCKTINMLPALFIPIIFFVIN